MTKLVFLSDEPGDAAWLAWGKSRLRALIDVLDGASFRKTVQVEEDVRVEFGHTIGAEGDYVRVTREQQNLAVWVDLPNPNAKRRLFVGIIPAKNGVVIVQVQDSIYPRPVYIYVRPDPQTIEGQFLFGSFVGTADLVVSFRPDPDFPARQEAVNTTTYYQYVSLGTVYNGTYTSYQYHPPENNVVQTSIAVHPMYLQAAGVAATYNVPKRIQVVDSNGGTVASYDVAVDGANEYPYTSAAWNGADFLSVFRKEGTDVFYVGRTPRFGVSNDCVYDHDARPPTYPGTDGNSAQWEADWAEAEVQFKARAVMWNQEKSNEVLESMKQTAYVLPVSWDRIIKQEAPDSEHTYGVLRMEASYEDEVESDTSANLTVAGVKTTKRTAQLQYTTAGATPEIRIYTLEGRLTQEVTAHADQYGTFIVNSIKDVYENWYDPQGPQAVRSTLYFAFTNDADGENYGAVLNGYIQHGQNATSMFGAVENPMTYDSLIPPYPQAVSTLEMVLSEFVVQYFAEQKVRYKKGAGDSTWLSSSLMSTNLVTVVPLEKSGPDNTRSLFFDGSPESIRVRIALSLRFDNTTGSVVSLSCRELSNPIVVGLSEEAELESNALIIYGGIKWDDVKEDARAQRKALADPDDPAHDPLMKAVLDALST